MHLVRPGHFRSRDKDGGRTIRSAVVENPMLHFNPMALSFIEPELLAIKVYITGIIILDLLVSCDLDLDPMTFIYELDPYCLELYRICKYELLRMSSFRKLSSDKHTYHSCIFSIHL